MARSPADARRLRSFGLPPSLLRADVDLAGDGGGDEGGARFSEQVDASARLVDEGPDRFGPLVKEASDGDLLSGRR